VLDGLKTVWQIPLLRALAVRAPLINFAFNGVLFAITVGLRQHGVSATVSGLVQGAVMAGGVLGAPVAPLLQGRMRHVGPPRWQREQLPVLVVQVDPVLAPVLAVGDELEVPAIQRVERVRHPDATVPIRRIGCS